MIKWLTIKYLILICHVIEILDNKKLFSSNVKSFSQSPFKQSTISKIILIFHSSPCIRAEIVFLSSWVNCRYVVENYFAWMITILLHVFTINFSFSYTANDHMIAMWCIRRIQLKIRIPVKPLVLSKSADKR